MGKLIAPARLTEAGHGAGVYLLHFEPRYKHAQHYLGYAPDLRRRIGEHMRGKARARLTTVAVAAGCRVLLARLWHGATRETERRLKGARSYPLSPAHHGSLAQRCPICMQIRREASRHA